MTWTKIDNTIIVAGKRVGPHAVYVYFVLAQHVDSDGACWPSLRRIANITGMTERTVRRCLRKLEECGFIITEPRRGDGATLTNLYRLTPPQSPPDTNDRGPGQKRRGGGDRNDGGPRTETTGEGTRLIELDPKNKAASAAGLPKILDTETFRTAWGDYITHRKEKRATMTPTAISKALAKLERMGHDRAVAALDHSVGNGWTGIHEPSTNGKKPEKPREEIVYRDPTH